VVNDVDGDLTAFWKALADPALFEGFRRRAQGTPFCEEVWAECRDLLQAGALDDDPARRAWAYFVLCRQSHMGALRTFAPRTQDRTRGGRNEQANAWLGAVDGLGAVHTRLKGVLVLNRDALDVIREFDAPETFYYLDPPYPHPTRAAKKVYRHEQDEGFHRRLLELLLRCKGRFVLSTYPNALYEGARRSGRWGRKDVPIKNHASGARKKGDEREALYFNYDPGEAVLGGGLPAGRRPRA
jgi:DNA adenine methylase